MPCTYIPVLVVLKSGKGRCTCEAKRLKLFVWLSAPGLPAPAVLFFALGLLHIDSSMPNNLLSLHKTTPKMTAAQLQNYFSHFLLASSASDSI
jgi:hypothetical protein